MLSLSDIATDILIPTSYHLPNLLDTVLVENWVSLTIGD
jgi:hypothetical protein